MMSERNKAKRYVFGAAMASVALSGIPGLLQHAQGQVVTNADFTFESVTVTGSHVGVFGTLPADIGTGTAYGSHAGNSAYSEPAGNGSAKALSTNVWAVGDYYEFDVPTTGITNIVVSFDEASSATGPRDFDLIAISGGTASSILSTYTIFSGSGSAFGGSASTSTAVHFAFSLSSLTTDSALDQNSSVAFRLQLVDTTNLTGGALGTGGTDRVDNFIVSGNSVPEPSSLALAGAGIAGLLLRRRREARS